jgi:quercetin dioxygenase-like cupin family protein
MRGVELCLTAGDAVLLTLAVFSMAASRLPRRMERRLTRNYRTLLDNEQVQVVRVHYDPHEVLAVHAHSHYPTVYVHLSNSGPGVCL